MKCITCSIINNYVDVVKTFMVKVKHSLFNVDAKYVQHDEMTLIIVTIKLNK